MLLLIIIFLNYLFLNILDILFITATGAGDIVTVNTSIPTRGGGGGGGGFGGGGKGGVFGPPPPLPQGRKKWGGPAQTALNVLQQADIVQGTTTLAKAEEPGRTSHHLYMLWRKHCFQFVPNFFRNFCEVL